MVPIGGVPPAGIGPPISYSLGLPVTFATHSQLAGYGFSWGPSDGQFGAIPAGIGNYTFYGTAGATSLCSGSPSVNGVFTFTGSLDRVTGSNGCRRLFGPGDGPAGWVFDRDYAGGGQVVRFSGGGKSGYLMPFHGEFHWKNMANPPGYKCTVGTSISLVPCFYSSLGLAISTDEGKTFEVVGQIFQPSQPLSVFQGSGSNMDVGYGSLLVADASGKHLDNPPVEQNDAYFYFFFSDLLPGSPGACAASNCMGVARARYADVVAAALSGNADQVANVFHKYDGASPDPWTRPATSDTPDLSGTAGRFAPLWTDEPTHEPFVIYDSSFDLYLAVYPHDGGFEVRASNDLIHWTGPIGPPYYETGRTLFYPTLLGETGDSNIGGAAPRVYFSSFPTGAFPDYKTSVFESVALRLSQAGGSGLRESFVQPGVWGSSLASLTIADGGTTLEILASGGCYGSYGNINQAIPVGAFTLNGTYTQLIGAYPGKIQYAAQYSGAVAGDQMAISVSVPDLQQTFGPFNLTYGVTTTWQPCRYP